MKTPEIDISCHGAIKLGQNVTCDGFVLGYRYRVQTHAHLDHMTHFDRSKMFQDILMSEATKSLLELKHIDLRERTNVIALPIDGSYRNNELSIDFKSSGHMLGAVQTAITTQDGHRFGYSGDFSWPLYDVIKVDSLVLDSTYGSPDSIRRYSQEDVYEAFRELVIASIKRGPITILAHQGTLFRAMELLDGLVQCPMIANKRKINEARVFRAFGYKVLELHDMDDPDVKKLRRESNFIEFHYTGEQLPYFRGDITTIHLTASWINGKEPYLELSDHSYQVALSDHADFNETLEYVKATGAKTVLTDDVRGNNADLLASAITSRLGIQARPAKPNYNRSWGE